MAGQNFIRVAFVAIGLSTLSFAAGVAGDLSIIDPPRTGQRVVLRIPPEIPAAAPRAAPILSTTSAEARPVRFVLESRPDRASLFIEAVQVAHETAFEAAPAAFEMASNADPKPQHPLRVKPTPDAIAAGHETKSV
ncbi:hypothetical protein [Candidatus Viadribacter manganicus]|uniref:Uncharacterized protein n=1 Tax=Candidatus Viadribacter manganicus TaxID=1759059 RepID=A0A1B1AFR1_9PROT|nr:hypothetical protein [Candidatus Viadribacter manganicus]ANP45390.1 hypothetical protein ATE48_05400 [Candidatus Viadribacter manganicus]